MAGDVLTGSTDLETVEGVPPCDPPVPGCPLCNPPYNNGRYCNRAEAVIVQPAEPDPGVAEGQEAFDAEVTRG